MIKATMVCTNCKDEKEIPRDELWKAITDDDVGELNLCSNCQKLWADKKTKHREDQAERFAELQKQFGIKN